MNFELLKERALEDGIKEIETYTLIKNHVSISTYNDEVESSQISNTIGIAIRGVYNNQISTVYVEDTNDTKIDFIVKKIKENASLINKEEPYFIYEGCKIYPKIKEEEKNFSKYTLKDKTDILLNLNKEAKKYSSLVDKTKASYSQVYIECQIENSNGLDVSKKDEYASISFSVICNYNEEMKTKYDYEYIDNLEDFDYISFSRKVVDKVIKTLEAKTIKSKSYPVVFDSYAFGNLMNTFTGVFSAENVIKKLSFLENKVNEQVFGKNITLIDDPLDKRAYLQSSFDDEGVATFKKVVVENGILKTYFHNLKTAKILNTKTTANAYKSSVASNVSISSSNFYIKNDDITFKDMIKDIKEGIYVTDLQGLHAGVNTINGDFSLQSSGFLIKEGKIEKPVTLIIVSGNIKKLLNDVVHISNDFDFKSGFGTGSVYVRQLSVSGE